MKRGRAPLLALAAGAVIAAALALTTPGTTGGFVAKVTNSTNTAGTAPYFTCLAAEKADMTANSFIWALGEASGTSAADSSGNGTTIPGTYSANTRDTATPMGCVRDTPANAFTSTAGNYVYSTSSANVSAGAFSMEVWFKTTSLTNGGLLLGLGDGQGSSGAGNPKWSTVAADRVLYLNTSGNLVFGARPSSTKTTVVSSSPVTANVWHDAIATVSATGATLYLDGAVVGTSSSITSGTISAVSGYYWRVGEDNLQGLSWSGATNNYFAGSIRYAAYYNGTTLGTTQVANRWTAGN